MGCVFHRQRRVEGGLLHYVGFGDLVTSGAGGVKHSGVVDVVIKRWHSRSLPVVNIVN